MEQYIVRKITKTIKDKYYHKFYDKRDKELKDKKYIDNIYWDCIFHLLMIIKININKSHKIGQLDMIQKIDLNIFTISIL